MDSTGIAFTKLIVLFIVAEMESIRLDYVVTTEQLSVCLKSVMFCYD
jgi:hypothetical protein